MFTITQTGVIGNTMTITVGGTLITSGTGTNVYQGELTMVKNNNVGNNGTYKIQTINRATLNTIEVTVPTGTPTCSSGSGCGTLFLGTPILGFGGSGTYNQPSTCPHPLCSGFGEHIKNLGFNCQFYDGCIGWQNLYAQEESNADTFVINSYNFVGFDNHGFGAQNFGPILNAEVYTGSGTNCGAGTVGGYIGDAQMRGLDGWTINNSSESDGNTPACAATPITAVMLDAPNTEVRNGHCEGTLNCVLMGANVGANGGASGGRVSGVTGGPSCPQGSTCNVVQVSNNNPNTKYVIDRIWTNGYSNSVQDNINNVTLGNSTLGDGFMAFYSYAGIRAGAIASGVSSNTDLAGQCTLGTNCINIPFSQTYHSAPICTCSDTSSTIDACNVQATLTTLTLLGSGSHTLNYICIGRN